MPRSDRPTPVAVLPTAFVVELTVDPTAEVAPAATSPTVEVAELTVPPTPPNRLLLLLEDEERAELVDRAEPLALMSLPNRSSLFARALALPLVIELMAA